MDEKNQPSGDQKNDMTNQDKTAEDSLNVPESNDLLESLLEKYVLVGLSADEWNSLASFLNGDQKAIRRYTETVHLRELLRDYSGGLAPIDSLLPDVGSIFRSGGVDTAKIAKHQEGAHQPEGTSESNYQVESIYPAVERRSFKPSYHWTSWLNISAAALLALFVGITSGVYFANLNRNQQANDFAAVEPSQSAPRLPIVFASGPKESLGRIIGLSPEASSDGLLRSYQVGDELRRGEVIQLTTGMMQVGFSDGPTAMIQGPAEFSVVGDHGLFVRYGQINTSASGSFEIQTSLLRIDSENAELAIVADRDKSTSVYSYSGKADVHSNSKRRLQDKLLRELKSGEGIEVKHSDASGLLEVADSFDTPGTAKRMIASWKDVTKSLHPYEQIVLSDNPLAYWPMHHVRRNRRVLDLSQNGFDGQAIGNWPVELDKSASAQIRGAYFDGESYIEPDSKPPIDIRTGFTIESWTKVMGGPGFQSIFTSRWVFGSNTPNQQCFGFTLYAGDDDRWQFWSGSGEYGKEWQVLISPTKVERHKWVHVSASFTPFEEDAQPEKAAGQWIVGLVKIYVDGVKVAEADHRMSLMDFEWPARIGAAEFVPKSLTSWLFQGDLRDIALYDYVVPAERIQFHYEAGESAI